MKEGRSWLWILLLLLVLPCALPTLMKSAGQTIAPGTTFGLVAGGLVFIVAIMLVPIVFRGRLANENGFEPIIASIGIMTVAFITVCTILVGVIL